MLEKDNTKKYFIRIYLSIFKVSHASYKIFEENVRFRKMNKLIKVNSNF